MSQSQRSDAPVPIPTPDEQLEEARSKKHKTTGDEAVIKLDEDLKSGKENPI